MSVHTYVYMYVPRRWGWFLGLGVLLPWNLTTVQGTSSSSHFRLWGGSGVVCIYLRRFVDIGVYVFMYVYMYIFIYAMGMVPRIGCTTFLESNYHARYLFFPTPPPSGGLGVVYVPT